MVEKNGIEELLLSSCNETIRARARVGRVLKGIFTKVILGTVNWINFNGALVDMKCVRRTNSGKVAPEWEKTDDPRNYLSETLKAINQGIELKKFHLRPGKCKECKLPVGHNCPIWEGPFFNQVVLVVANRDGRNPEEVYGELYERATGTNAANKRLSLLAVT